MFFDLLNEYLMIWEFFLPWRTSLQSAPDEAFVVVDVDLEGASFWLSVRVEFGLNLVVLVVECGRKS